jgi:hypothetical protein
LSIVQNKYSKIKLFWTIDIDLMLQTTLIKLMLSIQTVKYSCNQPDEL